MYHEIEGQLNIKSLIFDEEELIAGDKHYPYSEIEALEITSAPLFSTFGILTLRTGGRDIPVPFVRSRKNKLERALREYERMRDRGEIKPSDDPQAAQPLSPAPAASEAADPYEELKKLKELLDMDIITKEEFDAKKKQLLNL